MASNAGDVRDEVDAEALAEQFIAISSYALLLGGVWAPAHVDAVADLLMRGARR